MLAALAPLPARMITQSMRFDALAAMQQREASASGVSGLGDYEKFTWDETCDPEMSDELGTCVPWQGTITYKTQATSGGASATLPFVFNTGAVIPAEVRTLQPASPIQTMIGAGAKPPAAPSKEIIAGIPNSYLAGGGIALVALIVLARM